jgi:hypothetical protein
VRSQSGQVKLHTRKSSCTFSVFWIMNMISSPTPVSEAIAPPPSRRPSALGFALPRELRMAPTLACRASRVFRVLLAS